MEITWYQRHLQNWVLSPFCLLDLNLLAHVLLILMQLVTQVFLLICLTLPCSFILVDYLLQKFIGLQVILNVLICRLLWSIISLALRSQGLLLRFLLWHLNSFVDNRCVISKLRVVLMLQHKWWRARQLAYLDLTLYFYAQLAFVVQIDTMTLDLGVRALNI